MSVNIGVFFSERNRLGAIPSIPSVPSSEVPPVLNPPGSPIGHDPVTIGTPANGLSLIGQELSLGLASASTTGALSSTDWNTFNGKLNLTSPITGYTVGANTALTDTDTILQAFGKVQGQINARISGTIASGQVAFGTGANTVGGDADLTYNSTTNLLTLAGGITLTGARTIQTSTGNLTLATAAGNGNIILTPHGTGGVVLSKNTVIGATVGGVVSMYVSKNIEGGTSAFSFYSDSLVSSAVTGTASYYRTLARTQEATFTNNILSHFSANQGTIGAGSTVNNQYGFEAASTLIGAVNNYGFFGNIPSGSGRWNLYMNGNANNYLAGNLWIGTTSGTNTLDINGTTRIRTINNLGTAATSVLVPSATGVVSLRTLAEFRGDLGATTLGANLFTIPNPSAITFPRFNADNTVSALSASDFRTAIGLGNYVSYSGADSKSASERLQARVNIGSTSATPQIIATEGAINDLAVTSNHLVFTGASVVLSGIVAGLDGEEITILNASGTNLELLSQSTLSTAGNRFASGVIVPNLSIVRIKYRTTTARWVLENVGINDGRYLRKDTRDGISISQGSSLGVVFFRNLIDNVVLDIQDASGTRTAYWGSNGRIVGTGFSMTGNANTILGSNSGTTGVLQVRSNFDGSNTKIFNCLNNAGTEIFSVRGTEGNRGIRSLFSDGLTNRSELYLNYSQTVATTGTINDLAINTDCKLLILTGADDLTGVVPVDNTRLLRIEARSASRIIRHESASSTAANRFSIGSDLTINAGEVYQFIYTDSRWRRIL